MLPAHILAARSHIVAHSKRRQTVGCRSHFDEGRDTGTSTGGLPQQPLVLPATRVNVPSVALAEPPKKETPDVPGRTDLIMDATVEFLREELPRMFTTGVVTRSKYAADIKFQDPISRYTNLDGYCFNIAALTNLFNTKFTLHDIACTASGRIEARWSLSLESKLPLVLYKPAAQFTGIAVYTVDSNTGLITSHTDLWDSVSNNQFLSLEALRYVLSSFAQARLTPDLESPDYEVLFKTSEYEIRRYEPYTVAEVDMASGSGPAGGSGFTELAGYIFGGNESKVSMEMTTPVYSTGGQGGPNANKMQFPMERRFSDNLPRPNNSKVISKEEPGTVRAAIAFSGFPLDFEVYQAEKKLRSALETGNIKTSPGYLLARYNEPTVPPFLKRNEVLIDLPDYKLPALSH